MQPEDPPDAEEPAERLLTALRAQQQRVIDIFLRLDEDLSGAIDRQEFRSVLLFVAKDIKESFTRDAIDATFDLLDADDSGSIELKELDKLLRLGYTEVLARKLRAGTAGEIVLEAKNDIAIRKRERGGGGEQYGLAGGQTAGGRGTAHQRSLRSGDYTIVKEGERTIENSHKLEVVLDLEEGQSAEEALRQALTANAVRVIDLFHDWDVNGDGQISLKEFVTGVRLLGLPGGAAARSLFEGWDADGSGTLEIRELNRVLRRGNDIALPRVPDVAIALTARRNWSRRKVDGASGVVLHLPSSSSQLQQRGPLAAKPPPQPTHDVWRLNAATSGRISPLLQEARVAAAAQARSPDELTSHLSLSPTASTRARERASPSRAMSAASPERASAARSPLRSSASETTFVRAAIPPVDEQRFDAGPHLPVKQAVRATAADATSTAAAASTAASTSSPRQTRTARVRRSSPRLGRRAARGGATGAGATLTGHEKGDGARWAGYHGCVPSDAAGFFGMPSQLTPRGSAYLMPPTVIIDGSSRSRRAEKPLSRDEAKSAVSARENVRFAERERLGGAIYEDAARHAAPARVKAGRRAGAARQPLLTVSAERAAADTTVLLPGTLTERPITAGSELG